MSEIEQGAVGDARADSEVVNQQGAAAADVSGPAESDTAGSEPGPVSRTLQELDRLPGLDLAEHPALYQRIHAELNDALASIDES